MLIQAQTGHWSIKKTKPNQQKTCALCLQLQKNRSLQNCCSSLINARPASCGKAYFKVSFPTHCTLIKR